MWHLPCFRWAVSGIEKSLKDDDDGDGGGGDGDGDAYMLLLMI